MIFTIFLFLDEIFSGNEKQKKLLYGLTQSEESMKETSLNRNFNQIGCDRKELFNEGEESMEETREESEESTKETTLNRENCNVETDEYRVSSTGARITCDTSVAVINKYCAKLPGDK